MNCIYPLAAARLCLRLAQVLAARVANRRYAFSLAAVAVLSAKVVHIWAHRAALPTDHLALYIFAFFTQDVALLLVLRLLLDERSLSLAGRLQRVVTPMLGLVVAYVTLTSLVTCSFFASMGAEIQWRHALFGTSDAASRAVLLTGIVTFALVACALLAASWLLQDLVYAAMGCVTDMLRWSCSFLFRTLPGLVRGYRYTRLPHQHVESADMSEPEPKDRRFPFAIPWTTDSPSLMTLKLFACALIANTMLVQIILSIALPKSNVSIFMSWTPPLLPFVDIGNLLDTPVLPEKYRSGNSTTALHRPTQFSWLPQHTMNTPPVGFEDWYGGQEHYHASADALRVSNLQEQPLTEIRGLLKSLPIRHVMLVMLESTRKDVFPLKNGSHTWQHLAGSWPDQTLPAEAQAKMANLTPVANYLTGDYNDGLAHTERRRRGGLNFNNCHTSASYTLKSITSAVCGITSLTVDFNKEYKSHIYQPCLPHIFDVFNLLNHTDAASPSHPFASFKWRSSFMQSATLQFDKFDKLMLALGFPIERLIDKEYLKSSDAKFGTVHLPDVNYFGPVEDPLEEYIRDEFRTAKKNDERVFLTHITSTSHHPFGLPEGEEYVQLGRGMDDLSKYVNAIGYDDRWLGKILDLLDEEGVTDETLLVIVGDHGLPMPETDQVSSYKNTNAGNFHVPLIISNPKLPPIDVDDPVVSSQILPTILDMLVETGSLAGQGKDAASDLLKNYEGQSLLRPLVKKDVEAGTQDWQFGVINPGGTTLALRDASNPRWRLIVPLIKNIEWQFTDVASDPWEKEPIVDFDLKTLLRTVEDKKGHEASLWAEEAALVARWWVTDNRRRWRHRP